MYQLHYMVNVTMPDGHVTGFARTKILEVPDMQTAMFATCELFRDSALLVQDHHPTCQEIVLGTISSEKPDEKYVFPR